MTTKHKIKSIVNYFAIGLVSLLTTTNVGAWAQAQPPYGDITCAAFSPRVYNMAPVVRDTSQLRASLSDLLARLQFATEDGRTVTTASVYLPDLLPRLRRMQTQAVGFRESQVASELIGTVMSSITDDQMSRTFLGAYQRLLEMVSSDQTPWRTLRAQMFRVYDLARAYPLFIAALQYSRSLAVELPSELNALIEMANSPDDPKAVAARGVILDALSEESKLNPNPSLSAAGRIAMNSNRIFQELKYVGYPCQEARRIVAGIKSDVVRAPELRSEFGSQHVRYTGGGSQVSIPYPQGVVYQPKMLYPASKPLDPSKVPDLKRVYQGQYRVTDFAIGAFDNVVTTLEDPRRASATLNLLQTFKKRRFTIKYSPTVASRLGISDFPAHIRGVLDANNVPHSRVTFVTTALEVADLDFLYPWTRDGWLSAVDSQGNRIDLTRSTPNDSGSEGSFDFSTEGGAHYPVGQYIFLNKQLWSLDLADTAPASVAAYKERYRAAVGREPVLLDLGSESEGATTHVDLYLIFLPQPNGKPAIGVADLNLGRNLLANQNKNMVVARDFIMAQRTLRIPLEERSRIDGFEPASMGLPRYLPFGSFDQHRSKIDTSDSFLHGLDGKTLDANAAWLAEQGFEVFRFPYFPGYNQANGIPEVTAGGATFTTDSAPVFDAALAEAIGKYGYSLRLMPRSNSVGDGAGYHCLTNEARF